MSIDFYNLLLAAVISYLIGCVSPGYFFGYLVKRIDIRNFGNRGTGATNAYYIVGPVFGVLTAIFDVLKGGTAFLAAQYFIGRADLSMIVSLLSIIGHNYPFYLGFKGGRGMSASLGIIVFSLFYTRSLVAAAITVFLLVRSIVISERVKVIKPARKIYRMAGFLFPFWYWFFGQTPAFKLAVIITALFIILDFLRFLIPRFNNIFFKKLSAILKPKERKFFSTTTLFLISATLVIYYFPLHVAILAISYFLIGDTIAEIYGSVFRKFLMGRKSIEGSSIGLGFCFLAGLYLMDPLGVTLSFILKGAIFASIIEFSSQKIDDNLTIPLGTAVLLKFLG